MPLRPPARMPVPFVPLIMGLLDRDPSKRLGGDAVRTHAAFGPLFEWELMERQRLAAPSKPDQNLVYASDNIPSMADQLEPPGEDIVTSFHDWDCALPTAYDEELREYVRKSRTKAILATMGAPADMRDELGPEEKRPEDDEVPLMDDKYIQEAGDEAGD
eukprot:5327651-Prymnesium_polylepis.1